MIRLKKILNESDSGKFRVIDITKTFIGKLVYKTLDVDYAEYHDNGDVYIRIPKYMRTPDFLDRESEKIGNAGTGKTDKQVIRWIAWTLK
jgi:hypothetical protein